MFINNIILLPLLIILIPLFYLSNSNFIRHYLLLFFSILFLYIYNPVILIFILIIYLYFILLLNIFRITKKKIIPYFIFFPLLLPYSNFDSIILDSFINNNQHIGFAHSIYLGISFYLIKLFYQIRELNFNHSQNLLNITFFPSFQTGPIHNSKIFNNYGNLNFTNSLYRISLYFFKIYFLYQFFNNHISNFIFGIEFVLIDEKYFLSNFNFLLIYLFCIINFLLIYINFSAFCDLAIGISNLFGLQLNENFNKPYFSKNISDFWTRWHITMGFFIKTHIFIPILKLFKNVKLAFILSFIILGFWHSISFKWLIWGLFHGILLSFNSKIFIFHRYVNTFMTISFVSIISTYANTDINISNVFLSNL